MSTKLQAQSTELQAQSTKSQTQELLTTPSTIFSRLIADLQHARHSIDAEFYIVANDRTSKLFTELLRRKARQGISVRLTVDGYGSRSMSRRSLRALQRDGVVFHRTSPIGNLRNHRKMTIIDRRIAHIGGVNIADRYVVGNKLGTWHDAQLRFTGPAVESLERLFDNDTLNAQQYQSSNLPTAISNNELTLCWSEGEGGTAIERLFREVVESARSELIFTTPYFMPPAKALELLATAVARGVKVMVILPERSDVWVIDDVMRSYIARAMNLGIDIRICRHAFIHAKLAIIDRQRVVVGSANLDSRSMSINRELMAVSLNREVALKANLFVDRMAMLSTPPSERELRSRLPRFVVRLLEPIL